jgi:hypothetical protein
MTGISKGLIAFGVVFTCAGINLFFLLVKPTMDAKRILNKGTETTAAITAAHSNVRQGSEWYYYLKLFYFNTKGEKITAKTSSLYPQSFLVEQGIIEDNSSAMEPNVMKQLEVMYIGSKAVLKDFVPKDIEWWTWLYPLVFGGAGIIILLAVFLGPVIQLIKPPLIIKQIAAIILWLAVGCVFGGVGAGVYYYVLKPPMEARDILKRGAAATAKLISLEQNVTVNGERLYSLNLSFTNSKGEDITVKTRSIYPENFIRNEGIGAHNKYTGKYDIIKSEMIEIRYLGKKTIVKNFKPYNAPAAFWAFPVVFGGIGLVMIGSLIVGYLLAIKTFIMKHFGG